MNLLLPATKLVVPRLSRLFHGVAPYRWRRFRGLVYERPPIERKEAASHVEAGFEVGRNGAWGCPRGLRDRRHGQRLGHHPGRTGWSLFIGGATALAGGAVVIALGQVVFRLDNTDGDAVASDREKSPAPSDPAAKPQAKDLEQRSRQPSPQAPPPPTLAQTPPAQQAPPAVAPAVPPTHPATEPEREAEAPATNESSRRASRGRPLQSGDITYVMFSDGSLKSGH